MTITIENPTAEDAFRALRQLPPQELTRLKEMFAVIDFGEGYQDFWTDEDLNDARLSTSHLIEKRFGPEMVDYD